jgi:succinate dehydrogenase / fumarate reductase, membrane anchor subunit
MRSNNEMTTPLSRVRGLGSAKSGTGHFFQQRVTALANLPLSLFLIYLGCVLFPLDYAARKAFIALPFVSIGLICALISFTYHMRLGMQIIVEDYVHGELAKVLCVIANTLFTLLLALAGIFSVLKIAFGA